jgi:hypothetical protein
MIDRVNATLATRRTLGGPLSSLTRNHAILLANGDEQRALHSVGYPNRSEVSSCKRKWQVLVAPEGVIATDGIETGERLGLAEPGYGAWARRNRNVNPRSAQHVAQNSDVHRVQSAHRHSPQERDRVRRRTQGNRGSNPMVGGRRVNSESAAAREAPHSHGISVDTLEPSRERHGRPEVGFLAVYVDHLPRLAAAPAEMAEVKRECGDPYAREPLRKRRQTIIARKAKTISHNNARRTLPGRNVRPVDPGRAVHALRAERHLLDPHRHGHDGGMFWFRWNRLVGS